MHHAVMVTQVALKPLKFTASLYRDSISQVCRCATRSAAASVTNPEMPCCCVKMQNQDALGGTQRHTASKLMQVQWYRAAAAQEVPSERPCMSCLTPSSHTLYSQSVAAACSTGPDCQVKCAFGKCWVPVCKPVDIGCLSCSSRSRSLPGTLWKDPP